MINTGVTLELAKNIKASIINGDAPPDVINALFKAELWFLNKIKPGNMHIEDWKDMLRAMDIALVCQHTRRYVWQGISLPQDFPVVLRAIDLPFPSKVGVVVEENADVSNIQDWIRAQLPGISIQFTNPTQFDGAAYVEILPIHSIAKDYADLLKAERSAK